MESEVLAGRSGGERVVAQLDQFVRSSLTREWPVWLFGWATDSAVLRDTCPLSGVMVMPVRSVWFG